VGLPNTFNFLYTSGPRDFAQEMPQGFQFQDTGSVLLLRHLAVWHPKTWHTWAASSCSLTSVKWLKIPEDWESNGLAGELYLQLAYIGEVLFNLREQLGVTEAQDLSLYRTWLSFLPTRSALRSTSPVRL